MTPIISIVGKSNVGKTTLLEKLIAELVSSGYRVAAIKHNKHGFDLDRPGKDTWRLARAGASAVAIASAHQLAVMREVEGEPALEELLPLLGDGYDIVLTEGYKNGPAPKVEVFRAGVYDSLLCGDEDCLIAVATDVEVETGAPQFPLDNASALSDFIEEKFLKGPRRERTL
ncbi:MAG: molybdopterin-guanine dinucleotide biosynthesis protein B [Actinobacteria bacterium]|nr:molybdopterin-guanine dinucleotide biosynthesis protein B [Actinomycetota bacterium]